jgi:hypothetical protein
MVLHSGGVDESQSSRVKRVLGDGDKETGGRTGGKSREKLCDTRGGTSAEVDSLGISGEAITLLNEFGNRLSNNGNTLGMRISANGSNLSNKGLGTLNRVLFKEQLRIGILEEIRVLNQSKDLSVKGDGVLIKLLGVTNIGVDDLFKRKGIGVSLELLAELLSAESESAADCVFGVDYVFVKLVDSERGHFVRSRRVKERKGRRGEGRRRERRGADSGFKWKFFL